MKSVPSKRQAHQVKRKRNERCVAISCERKFLHRWNEIFLPFFPCCLFESVRFPSARKIVGKKRTPKYFFRSANPNGSNRFLDGQRPAKFLLSCSSQPRDWTYIIIIIHASTILFHFFTKISKWEKNGLNIYRIRISGSK